MRRRIKVSGSNVYNIRTGERKSAKAGRMLMRRNIAMLLSLVILYYGVWTRNRMLVPVAFLACWAVLIWTLILFFKPYPEDNDD